MLLKGFVVRDSKSNAFAQPFFAPTVGMACRMFGDWCKDTNTVLGQHPEDFSLFLIGAFDDEKARFENEVAPALVAQGSDSAEPGVPRLVKGGGDDAV